MNQLKSIIKDQENKRRRNFFLKLILLVILVISFESNSRLSPFFDTYLIASNLIRAVIFLLSGNLIISLARIITLQFYLKKREDIRVQPNFVIGIDRLSSLFNIIVFLITLMLAFGVRPLEFLTSITIVAAAIALLTKDYITNIVNGLIMMFSDQLEIGDKIKIGNSLGFIRDITLINMELKSETGEIIIIPNTLALTSEVVNYSKNNSHQVIMDSEIPFYSAIQLSDLEKVLNASLSEFSDYIYIEGSQLNILDHKPESIIIRYQFPIKSGEKIVERNVKKTINQALINWSNETRKA
ncbi:mechanosensitive ion channel-like protein [Algoriphagus ratkowskyi]|uniref:Mechanosensitive ion channel n=1 Tax=Algoriphagus ratkowskyi TaxID=57028 RepID=A0A2W7SBH3_9BACT|nr:mechanosensitive ion channel domain-containing protein [Algoriphagus ratkowskyi]PZX60215.1 mechanosensitive ion channel-like protein [Algoriphagus ratkowskyi]TXD78040.1 mechanosensitive ion channel [Algoriphagus ratkowskyi]